MTERIIHWIAGVGSAMNIFPDSHGRYDSIVYRARTDTEALRGDWEKVGNDIRKAITTYEQKESKQKSAS